MNLSKSAILFGFLQDQAKEGNLFIFVVIFANLSGSRHTEQTKLLVHFLQFYTVNLYIIFYKNIY